MNDYQDYDDESDDQDPHLPDKLSIHLNKNDDDD
jgi:hypothetical protein